MRRFVRIAFALLLACPSLAGPVRTAAAAEQGEFAQEDIEARQRWRLERRLGPDGRYDAMAPLRARLELAARTRPTQATGATGTTDAGIWNWDWLGPGNIGGRVRALVIHPTTPNTMWAGTAGGGIWRTTNGGNSWFPMTDFLPSLAVASLVLDPTDPTTLYAGTGELVGSNWTIAGAGIFKSMNSGLTWTQLPRTMDFAYVSSLAHHPTEAGVVLAGTQAGVFRTPDGGVTWYPFFTPTDGPADLRAVRYVGYHPGFPNMIAVGTLSNFYLSTNGGLTFTLQTSGAPGKMPTNPGDCVAAFPKNFSKHLFVQAASTIPVINDTTDWIYESRDSGQTWSPILRTNADNWSNAIWVAPNDTNLIVFGGFGDLRRSTNGSTAIWISNGSLYRLGNSAHGDQHAIVPHPNYNGSSNRTVFIANDGGVQRVTDIATVTTIAGWTNLANNLGCSQFFTGAAAPDGSVIMGGMQDVGTAMLGPGGGPQDWTTPGDGDGFNCAIDPTNTQRRYLSAQNLSIRRTFNGGTEWIDAVTGLDDWANGTCDFAAPLAMSPHNPLTLWAGGESLWRSTDGAANWERRRYPIAGYPRCVAIAFSASDPNVMWVGYNNGTVSYSWNGGNSWTDHVVEAGRWITDIAINPAVATEVFVTLNHTSTDNVRFTYNAGATWEVRNGSGATGLPTIAVSSVTYHPLQPNWVYVGTDIGVFASEDKGLNWSVTASGAGNEGPNNVEVDDLFWQGTTHLLAATHGRGIYRCTPLPIVYVDKFYAGPEDGSQARPFNTVAEAVAAYGPGAIVQIENGTYPEPPLVLGKRGVFRSSNGVARIE